ncbi:MAG TPA: DinB family protein [Candidatus Limnocylindrales bacterium]|nr:DinB family protein [Candidatus Limnocylindrales bacterium]
MTISMTADRLVGLTADFPTRPMPPALRGARSDVLAAARELASIADDRLTVPWTWRGGSEEELRYGFYRIAESFELASIEAADALRANGIVRGRAGDLIAPATAARWDLGGLLETLTPSDWDADPGGGEWSIRQTIGHVVSSQRGYGVGTAWWASQRFRADDPALPRATPDELREGLPSEEDDALGTPAEIRERLDELLDLSAERLAALDADRLAAGGRWSGFPVDVAFRLGRWSSHMREHTIQVEKTLVLLRRNPTEVQRLVRLVLAAWGRAEAVVYGAADADAAIAILADAAAGARATAAEVVATAAV